MNADYDAPHPRFTEFLNRALEDPEVRAAYESAQRRNDMTENAHETSSLTQTQNERGEWVPAIPEPYFLAFSRVRCDCGERFRNRGRYREHYALAHILGLG